MFGIPHGLVGAFFGGAMPSRQVAAMALVKSIIVGACQATRECCHMGSPTTWMSRPYSLISFFWQLVTRTGPEVFVSHVTCYLCSASCVEVFCASSPTIWLSDGVSIKISILVLPYLRQGLWRMECTHDLDTARHLKHHWETIAWEIQNMKHIANKNLEDGAAQLGAPLIVATPLITVTSFCCCCLWMYSGAYAGLDQHDQVGIEHWNPYRTWQSEISPWWICAKLIGRRTLTWCHRTW